MHFEIVTLGLDGRIVIPIAARRELGLKPGAPLVIESDGSSILVRSQEEALRESQDYFRQFATSGVSEVDDLIAERRRDAAMEADDIKPSRKPRG